MLSYALNSQRAIQVNIYIIRVINRISKVLADTNDLRQEIDRIKQKLNNQSQNIELVFKYLDELVEKREKPGTRIGFAILTHQQRK